MLPRLQHVGVSLLTWMLGLLVLASARADDPGDNLPAAKPPKYSFRRVHDPNGIGKFYLGREIAQVMGHQGIQWLERSEREEEERLSQLMEALRLESGMVVADIGAGSGLISRMMAHRIGEEGIVLAVDIQQEMLDALQVRNKLAGIVNIEPVLGDVKSPRLKPESVDLVVMVDVYHEFEFPYEMLLEISRSLKPGGRIAFVEYRKEDPRVPIKEIHKMTERQVKREATLPEFGLEWEETYRKLPRQHVVLFRKRPAKDDLPPS